MFKFIFFNILLLAYVYADDKPCPPLPETNKVIPILEKIAEKVRQEVKIDWWSASEEQIDQKKCKKDLPTLEDIEKDIIVRASPSIEGKNIINHVEFENESAELLKAFSRLTTKINFFDKPEENQQNTQELYKINPECKKVKCAVEKIFGKELGNKILYMNLKFGFNSSEFAFKNAERLKVSELDNLMHASLDYPANRFPLNENKQLTKFLNKRRLAIHDEKTVAYAVISFYDAWSEFRSQKQQYTAFHEMAHYIGAELKLDNNPQWLKISDWTEKDDKWTSAKSHTFCSHYGETNPVEDFAESVSAYRYNPKLLKEISPEKYQFIKETVFDGLEFDTESSCAEEKSYSAKLQNIVNKKISTPLTQEQVLEHCMAQVSDFILNLASGTQKLDVCLAQTQLKENFAQEIIKLDPALTYPDLYKNSLMRQQLPLTRNATTSFPEAVKAIKLQMIDDIYNWDQGNSYAYGPYFGAGTGKVNSCANIWDKYGYQALFKSRAKKGFEIYNKKDEFSLLLFNLCEKINTDREKIAPLTRPEIEKVIDEAMKK